MSMDMRRAMSCKYVFADGRQCIRTDVLGDSEFCTIHDAPISPGTTERMDWADIPELRRLLAEVEAAREVADLRASYWSLRTDPGVVVAIGNLGRCAADALPALLDELERLRNVAEAARSAAQTLAWASGAFDTDSLGEVWAAHGRVPLNDLLDALARLDGEEER